jgi:translation initiation factor IF-1
MPGISARSTKKRINKLSENRLKSSHKYSDAIAHGEVKGCVLGKIIKHLGNSRVSVMTYDHDDASFRPKMYQAVIRNLLRKKNVTPMYSGDIVIMTPREFESRSSSDCRILDIVSVVDRKYTNALIKEGVVPSWINEAVNNCGLSDEGDDIFDYSQGPSGEDDFTSEDIDNI